MTLIVYSVTGFCQESKPLISGIGIFKIDKTKRQVIDSLITAGFSVDSCQLACNLKKQDSKKILFPTTTNEIDYPLLKDHSVAFIINYDVAGIQINNMRLDFYKGILYNIAIANINTDLSDALKLKYDYTFKQDKQLIVCSSPYVSYERDEITTNIKFKTKPSYIANITFNDHYTSNCEKNSSSFFLIENSNTSKIVKDIESKIIYNGKNEENKNSKYNDL